MSETIHRIVELADQLQLSRQYSNRGAAIQEAARQCGVKQSRPGTIAPSGDGTMTQDTPLARACQRLIDAACVTGQPGAATEQPGTAAEQDTPLGRACQRLIDQARTTEHPGRGSVASPLGRAVERLIAAAGR